MRSLKLVVLGTNVRVGVGPRLFPRLAANLSTASEDPTKIHFKASPTVHPLLDKKIKNVPIV